jgi:hypothetical protein
LRFFRLFCHAINLLQCSTGQNAPTGEIRNGQSKISEDPVIFLVKLAKLISKGSNQPNQKASKNLYFLLNIRYRLDENPRNSKIGADKSIGEIV